MYWAPSSSSMGKEAFLVALIYGDGLVFVGGFAVPVGESRLNLCKALSGICPGDVQHVVFAEGADIGDPAGGCQRQLGSSALGAVNTHGADPESRDAFCILQGSGCSNSQRKRRPQTVLCHRRIRRKRGNSSQCRSRRDPMPAGFRWCRQNGSQAFRPVGAAGVWDWPSETTRRPRFSW